MILKSKLLGKNIIGILLGVAIIAVVFALFYEIQFNQDKVIESNKNSFKYSIENMIDRRQTRIQTIANSIIAFIEGSEHITFNEFSVFNKRILEINPEIIGTFILENDVIVNSYPDQNLVGKDFDSVFNQFPIMVNNKKVLSAEFFIDKNGSVVVLVPYNYFIILDEILNDNYKIIIDNPITDGKLFEYEKIQGKIQQENIEFSNKELMNSVHITKKTEIYGHKIKQNYIINARIWDDSFSNEIDFDEIIMILFGISVAIIVSIQSIKLLELNKSLKSQSVKLEDSNKRLVKSKKDKDEFIAMMSHELKTPLTAITVWVDALKQPEMLGKLSQEQDEAIGEIYTAATHLTEMINNFFDVFKLDLGKVIIIKNEIIVEELMEKIRRTYEKRCEEKGISIINSTTGHIILDNDEKRIRQVLGNLINNAIDFVPGKTGKIEICAYQNEKSKVVFFVQDNGIGIGKDEQSNLFHKFYQVDTSATRQHGGTGLGLSICKGLVEAMGGKIWVESKKGKGSKFYFMLPNLLSKKMIENPFEFLH